MRTPTARLTSSALAAALALPWALPLAVALPLHAAETKAAAGKGADLAELQAALEAGSATRIECKAAAAVRIPKDGKQVDAMLVAVDLAAAHCTGKDGADITVPWSAIGSGSSAAELLKKAVDPKDAGHHLLAARILANLKMGGAMAEYHLKQAAALDKTAAAPKAKDAMALLAVADFNKTRPEWAWPRLTPAKHAECMEAADAFMKTTAKKAGLPLRLAGQTEHFACYSDADADAVRNWTKKFEVGYANLCKVFGLDPRQNIFKGKCTVVLCRNRASYAKWLGAAFPDHPGLATATLGLHGANQIHDGSSTVHIAHDPARKAQVEHTMGHELSHAFAGLFHGTHHLPNWVNEGLAEYIASNGQGSEARIQESRERIRRAGSLETFFSAPNIQGHHYGAAFEITRLLIKKNPQGYARFVKALTQGMDVEEALKLNCGLTLEQLTAGYAKSLGLQGLKAK